MKIVLEVSNETIANCNSLNHILELFALELQSNNKALYHYIFDEGVDRGWAEAEEQWDNGNYPDCGCYY